MHANEIEARWMTFLEENSDIGALALKWPEQRSLTVSFREVYSFDQDFAEIFLINPSLSLRCGDSALRKICKEKNYQINPLIRVRDLPPDQRRAVRNIRQDDVGSMLAIDAIVVKISSVRPRVVEAAFRCCNGNCESIQMIYQSNEQELVEPMICDPNTGCGAEKPQARFEIVPSQSVLENTQFIELQEPPEKLRGGVQPERLSCLIEGEIAGQILPGDRIVANGELFVRSKKKHNKKSTLFDIFLRVNSFEQRNTPFEDVKISPEDEAEIKELSFRVDLYELMSRSIAPSIFGYSNVKESLLLQLFGGVARRNPDGTRQRGDMHILLMGDPGTAKSQMLHYMSELSPRGQYTSGRSASAAGLTAAAVSDSTSDGRWTLEAGALPLADTGLAAIDEFDKMNDSDRSSIHEAMEQQTISISKAGINAKLRTRCSILAASNPKGGRFLHPDEAGPYTRQVNLPPPLFSRFDVIWLMADTPAEEHDKMIATHILANRQSGVDEYSIEQGNALDPMLNVSQESSQDHDGKEILSREMFRKYVAYAKRNHQPVLDDNARKRIIDYYTTMRGKVTASADNLEKGKDVITITARALEALSRMTEASAKVRLSNIAEEEDVRRALRLFENWRHELMGDNFDETSIESGKTIKGRNLESYLKRTIGDILEGTKANATTSDILQMARTDGFDDDRVINTLETLRINGAIYSPSFGSWALP
jgi:replicative DNA helicase Mcm